MGGEKQQSTGTTVVNQTTTPTPTPEETALNQRNLRIALATEAGQTQAQQSGLNLINQLLLGQQPTGPLFEQIKGISPEAMGLQATELARQALPQYQNAGILDSGVSQRETARTIANQLVYPSAQFNVGAGQNLLNLAMGGQAQVQAPIQNNVNTLAGSLAGLRSINTQGTTTTNQTQTSMNPFLRSFQTSLGQTLGSPSFKTGPFNF